MVGAADNEVEGELPDTELDDVLDDTEEGNDDTAEEGDGDEETTTEGDGSEAPAGEDGDGEPAPSRRTVRVQKLEKERDTATATAAELQKRLDEVLAAQRTAPVPDAAALKAEADRIAAMEPVDRVKYEADKKISALQSQLNGLGFHITDASDKASFEAKATINPIYKKYLPAVEKDLADMRKNGVNTTREAILTYKIGEDARKRLEQKGNGEQRRRAAANRVETARGRPANGRSDQGTSRSEKSLEDRLRGVQL